MIGGLDKVGSAPVKPLLYICIVLFKHCGEHWLAKIQKQMGGRMVIIEGQRASNTPIYNYNISTPHL
jgi:hypothetical protein